MGSNMKCYYIVQINLTVLTVTVKAYFFHKKKIQHRALSHKCTAAMLAS